MNVREAASLYISLGWYPIPLRPGTKECKDKSWRDKVYSVDDFKEDDNIGIRLVNASDIRSKKLVSVDLDANESVAVAAKFLPPSNASWGRKSKPLSQALYLSPFEKPVTFKDIVSGTTLVEIRVNHQSMAPPSIHPCGEELSWSQPTDHLEAPEVAPDVLQRAVRLIATAAMVTRYYSQPGNRHDWCLALTGALRQFSLSEDEVTNVVSAAAIASGDPKPKDRLLEVHSTFARGEDDFSAITGAPRLAEIMGDNGKGFVDTLRKIWGERSPFLLDDRTKKPIANNQENIRKALDAIGVTLSHNKFSQRLVVHRGEFQDYLDDALMDRLWLDIDSKFHFRPQREFFECVMRDTARKTPHHPILEYLSRLVWDGKKRIDTWLIEYGGAADSPFNRTVGAIVLIAAVRRVTRPGCKFDELLVLESEQGRGKSTMLRALCPRDEWFSDDLPLGLEAKQVIERTTGKWIIEAAELTNIRKTQVEQLKSFLSRQIDGPVRLAYGRMATELPRQFLVIGTTNSRTYLRDASGNRRFWPVQIKKFDVPAIIRDRDQLWAEAAIRERANESIRLHEAMWSVAAKEQDKRRTEDPWEGPILSMINSLPAGRQRLTPEDVWSVLNMPLERRDERAAERVGNILQHAGFRRMSVRTKTDGVTRGWGRDQQKTMVEET